MEPRIIRRRIEWSRAEQGVERLGLLAYTGNSLGHRLELTLEDGGQAVSMDGYAAKAYFLLGGEGAMKLAADAQAAGNVVSVTFPAQAYAAGQASVLVTAEAGETSIPLYAACYTVRSAQAQTLIDPEDVVPDLPQLLAQIEAMKAASSAADEAAQAASTAAQNADAAAGRIQNMRVAATTLAAGSAATADISDDGTGKVVTIGVPRGETGATPEIAFSVSTGEAGTQAQNEQGGTAQNPTLHLTIPRGEPGESGPAMSEIVNAVYPVGIVLDFAQEVDPNSAIGCGTTWERLEDGRALIASDASHPVGWTGGEATVKLTSQQIPMHRHSVPSSLEGSSTWSAGQVYPTGEYATAGETISRTGMYSSYVGGSQAHENMQPSLAVCRWKRTA